MPSLIIYYNLKDSLGDHSTREQHERESASALAASDGALGAGSTPRDAPGDAGAATELSRDALVAAASPGIALPGAAAPEVGGAVAADDLRELVRSAWELACALELDAPRAGPRACALPRRLLVRVCCTLARFPLGALLFSCSEGALARYFIQRRARAASKAAKAGVVRGVSALTRGLAAINAAARLRAQRAAAGIDDCSDEASGVDDVAEAKARARLCVDARRALAAAAAASPAAKVIDSAVLVRAARLAHEFANCEVLLSSFVAECFEHVVVCIVAANS